MLIETYNIFEFDHHGLFFDMKMGMESG